MAVNRLESPKQPPAEETGRNGHDQPQPSTGGGFKAWLPLITNIILMPVIAYAVTTYILVPKLGGATAPSAKEKKAEPRENTNGQGQARPSKNKITAALSGKVLVNVAGTMGTRYLIANMTLVGAAPEFKASVEENDPQLRDAAAGILAAKTISDLEKPGVRNMIRTELISAFNDILGKEAVNEIYLTEFAIQ